MSLTPMSRKKTNPRRVPVSAAVAEARGFRRAAEIDWAIFSTVLRDKEGYDADGIARVWAEVEALSDSIAKGYVNVMDLIKALKTETAEEARRSVDNENH